MFSFFFGAMSSKSLSLCDVFFFFVPNLCGLFFIFLFVLFFLSSPSDCLPPLRQFLNHRFKMSSRASSSHTFVVVVVSSVPANRRLFSWCLLKGCQIVVSFINCCLLLHYSLFTITTILRSVLYIFVDLEKNERGRVWGTDKFFLSSK